MILFVLGKEQVSRLEVGAGLARVLTPEGSRRLLDERIAPLLAAGQPEVALSSAVDGLVAQLTAAPIVAMPPRDRISLQQWFVIGLALLGALGVLAVARPESARWLLTLRFLRRRGPNLASR